MDNDIKIKIINRQGIEHEVLAPTDMAMNLMEVIRSYELAQRELLVYVVVWQCVHHVSAMFHQIIYFQK